MSSTTPPLSHEQFLRLALQNMPGVVVSVIRLRDDRYELVGGALAEDLGMAQWESRVWYECVPEARRDAVGLMVDSARRGQGFEREHLVGDRVLAINCVPMPAHRAPDYALFVGIDVTAMRRAAERLVSQLSQRPPPR